MLFFIYLILVPHTHIARSQHPLLTGYYVPAKTPVQLATTLLPFLCIPLHHHRDSSLSHHWPQQPRCCSFGTAAEVITGLNTLAPVPLYSIASPESTAVEVIIGLNNLAVVHSPFITSPQKQQQKSSLVSTTLPHFLPNCSGSHHRPKQHYRRSFAFHHITTETTTKTAAEVITGLNNLVVFPSKQ